MLAIAGLAAVAGLLLPLTAYRGRGARIALDGAALDFADHARRQLPILAGQAAFAVTAIVLLITLARDRAVGLGAQFDAVVGMFLVAFVSFIGAAIMLSLLPTIEERGPLVTRLLFALGAHQHFRTLFLAWFALRPLVAAYALDAVADLLAAILVVTMLAGWTIVSALDYRAGIMAARDALVLPGAGVVLALGFGLLVRVAAPGAAQPATPLVLAFVMFLLNALTMLVSAAVPMLVDGARGRGLVERSARAYAVADFQATTIVLTFTWLAVVGVL